ncbi:MAG: hypothetical protein ABIQ31_19515 [Ferruginibacter sp.]
MLGFIVPIKSLAVSKDWNYDNKLLERTCKSICAQTDQDFKLVIVHKEKPVIDFDHPNLVYLNYDFPILPYTDMEDFDSYVTLYYKKDYAEKMMDKGRKIMFGCNLAKELGCNYMIAIDSDDLVSNRMASFVNSAQSAKGAGWRINKGYVHEENSSLVLLNNKIYGINGSTHIIRADLVLIPDFTSRKFWDYNLYEAHGYTVDRIRHFHAEVMAEYNECGIMYIIHKNNFSNVKKIIFGFSVKNILKKCLMAKFLTRGIRSEYGLYKLKN